MRAKEANKCRRAGGRLRGFHGGHAACSEQEENIRTIYMQNVKKQVDFFLQSGKPRERRFETTNFSLNRNRQQR